MNRAGRRVLRVDRVAMVEIGLSTHLSEIRVVTRVTPSLSPSRRSAAKGGRQTG